MRATERLELFLYRRSSAVVALTEAFKGDLASRGVSAAKIAVVRNGVDIDRHPRSPIDPVLASELGLEGKFVVGYIGTHGLAHDLHNVLDTAERLSPRSEIAFLLVGGGAVRDDLIAETERRGLSNVRARR